MGIPVCEHREGNSFILWYEAGELPLPGWKKVWLGNEEVVDGLPATLPAGVVF
jgi:hypothetical protein